MLSRKHSPSRKGAPSIMNKARVAIIFCLAIASLFLLPAGEAAPFSVMSYKDVRPWAKSIREKVVNREMPPWHADPHVQEFKNNRSLTPAEIDAITAWVDGGSQEGDPKDLPPPPKFED